MPASATSSTPAASDESLHPSIKLTSVSFTDKSQTECGLPVILVQAPTPRATMTTEVEKRRSTLIPPCRLTLGFQEVCGVLCISRTLRDVGSPLENKTEAGDHVLRPRAQPPTAVPPSKDLFQGWNEFERNKPSSGSSFDPADNIFDQKVDPFAGVAPCSPTVTLEDLRRESESESGHFAMKITVQKVDSKEDGGVLEAVCRGYGALARQLVCGWKSNMQQGGRLLSWIHPMREWYHTRNRENSRGGEKPEDWIHV